VYSPFAGVAKGWTRLRVLNGSTARVYNLGLSNGGLLHIIGSDGGLLATPRSAASLMLGPGERADVMVNFSELSIGQEVYLVSHKFSEFGQQGRQYFPIMKFVVDRETTSVNTLPAMLSNLPVLPEATAVRTRRFDISLLVGGMGPMGRHSINGKVFEMERVDETVEAGTTEIWEFDNAKGDEIHPMHIHGVQFQVLGRTGGRGQLTAAEYGWKDTILVMPFESVRVIMTFPLYTGTFVFHCHNLEHEDDGMMLNYTII
jgi:FtsP/CotA-like multicopper oxidase with cupredoxin domain